MEARFAATPVWIDDFLLYAYSIFLLSKTSSLPTFSVIPSLFYLVSNALSFLGLLFKVSLHKTKLTST